jgi:hypothetical protein
MNLVTLHNSLKKTWAVTLCSLLEIYERFGGTFWLHLQALKVCIVSKQQSRPILRLCRWTQYVSTKHW